MLFRKLLAVLEFLASDSWGLKLTGICHLVSRHPDNTRRVEWFNKLNRPEYKCLQVGVFIGVQHKYGPNWTSIDKYDMRPCIDYNYDVCNWDELREFEGVFDFIQCNAILEHVKQPFDAARNLKRMLKPGGVVYVEVPFVQPYHPHRDYEEDEGMLVEGVEGRAPHGGDYWRFTPQGLYELFAPIDVKDLFLADEGAVVLVGRKSL